MISQGTYSTYFVSSSLLVFLLLERRMITQRWTLINVAYLLFSAQAELCGGLSKLSVAAAPLEQRKGDTQHLLVSTSDIKLAKISGYGARRDTQYLVGKILYLISDQIMDIRL